MQPTVVKLFGLPVSYEDLYLVLRQIFDTWELEVADNHRRQREQDLLDVTLPGKYADDWRDRMKLFAGIMEARDFRVGDRVMINPFKAVARRWQLVGIVVEVGCFIHVEQDVGRFDRSHVRVLWHNDQGDVRCAVHHKDYLAFEDEDVYHYSD